MERLFGGETFENWRVTSSTRLLSDWSATGSAVVECFSLSKWTWFRNHLQIFIALRERHFIANDSTPRIRWRQGASPSGGRSRTSPDDTRGWKMVFIIPPATGSSSSFLRRPFLFYYCTSLVHFRRHLSESTWQRRLTNFLKLTLLLCSLRWTLKTK